MKKNRLIIVATLFFSLLLSGFAFADTHSELVEKYISISGVKEALSQIPGQLEAQSRQRQLSSQDIETEKEVAEIMINAYDVGLAEKTLSSYLLENSDIELMKALVKWWESPLARKIADEETFSSAPENQPDMMRYMGDMQVTPPSEERIAIILEFNEVTKIGDRAADMALATMRGMLASMNEIAPEEQRKTSMEINKLIEKIDPLMRAGLTKQMIMASYYIYRNISNDEMNKYIGFYRSELGQKELSLTGDALSHALNVSFSEMAAKLTAYAKEKQQTM